MNIVEKPIEFGGESLLLTNQRAIYWESQQTLILSDLHVGKAAHFRKSGIALPVQVAGKDIARLSDLIKYYQPASVLITGDLLHAGMNSEVALLRTLILESRATEFLLVKGNHDRLADQEFANLGIRILDEGYTLGNLSFAHGHRDTAAQTHEICGHYHPGVHVQMGRKSAMRFPCYVLSEKQLILPAFSLFSGLDTRCVPDGSSCYAIYEDGLFRVSC